MKDRNELGADSKNIIEGEKEFTVFDVFSELLSEISFCGFPEDRDEKLQDTIDIKDEYEKKLEEEKLKEEEEEDDDI
jgi:hypothetical protein